MPWCNFHKGEVNTRAFFAGLKALRRVVGCIPALPITAMLPQHYLAQIAMPVQVSDLYNYQVARVFA